MLVFFFFIYCILKGRGLKSKRDGVPGSILVHIMHIDLLYKLNILNILNIFWRFYAYV